MNDTCIYNSSVEAVSLELFRLATSISFIFYATLLLNISLPHELKMSSPQNVWAVDKQKQQCCRVIMQQCIQNPWYAMTLENKPGNGRRGEKKIWSRNMNIVSRLSGTIVRFVKETRWPPHVTWIKSRDVQRIDTWLHTSVSCSHLSTDSLIPLLLSTYWLLRSRKNENISGADS